MIHPPEAEPTEIQALLARRLQATGVALALIDTGSIARWAETATARFREGALLLSAGNGGSAAQASHLAAELVGRYEQDRPPLRALSLTSEPAILTALGNDYGFGDVFARQIDALGRSGDLLLLLSTSGTSPNITQAARAGRSRGMLVWGLTGPGPNELAELCDSAISITAGTTAVVQECHLVAIHLLCAAIDLHIAAAAPAALGPADSRP